MSKSKSEWLTPELAKTYLRGVRGAIPAADLQLAVIDKIVGTWCAQPLRFLDLGCGDGILGRHLLQSFSGSKGVFVDFSDPMLEATRNALQDPRRAIIVKSDFGDPAWSEQVVGSGPFNLVVSGFSIHHQPDARKKVLYAELFDLLEPGGTFLNLEHVLSTSPAGALVFAEFFIDHLFAYHLHSDPGAKRDVIAAEYYGRPDKGENILAPVDEQCRWLREIGFEDVDCFFKVLELALFGGRKAADRPATSRG